MMCPSNSQDDDSMPIFLFNSHGDAAIWIRCVKSGRIMINEEALAYVSTQLSDQFDTFLVNHFTL
jgi:hypothetical protein